MKKGKGFPIFQMQKRKKKQVRWLFIKVNPVKGVSVNDKHLFYSACLEEEKNTLKVGQM